MRSCSVSAVCMLGLTDEHGIPSQKATGWVSDSEPVLRRLSVLCDGSRQHSPLEGGRRTRAAGSWGKKLCMAIAAGIVEQARLDIVAQGCRSYPAIEAPIDISTDDEDNLDEMEFDEGDEEALDQEQAAGADEHDPPEAGRQPRDPALTEWMTYPKKLRQALRRLHEQFSHPGNRAFAMMLKRGRRERKP